MPPKKDKKVTFEELKLLEKQIPQLKVKDTKKKDIEKIFDKKK
tara:strand:+ start:649 stop:777 length:129 start_codon:yes stop_codon:yes gene_type:complete